MSKILVPNSLGLEIFYVIVTFELDAYCDHKTIPRQKQCNNATRQNLVYVNFKNTVQLRHNDKQ